MKLINLIIEKAKPIIVISSILVIFVGIIYSTITLVYHTKKEKPVFQYTFQNFEKEGRFTKTTSGYYMIADEDGVVADSLEEVKKGDLIAVTRILEDGREKIKMYHLYRDGKIDLSKNGED